MEGNLIELSRTVLTCLQDFEPSSRSFQSMAQTDRTYPLSLLWLDCEIRDWRDSNAAPNYENRFRSGFYGIYLATGLIAGLFFIVLVE